MIALLTSPSKDLERKKIAWRRFQERYPDTFPDILDQHHGLQVLPSGPISLASRQATFKKFVKRITQMVSFAYASTLVRGSHEAP